VKQDPGYFDRVAEVSRAYYRGEFAAFLAQVKAAGLD
jgi:hypothetical protein